jgi:hypothetical protein
MNLTTTTRDAEAVPQEEACEDVTLDDDDMGSVVGDAIPRSVQMDNKVRNFLSSLAGPPYSDRIDRTRMHTERHQIGPISSMYGDELRR